MPIYPYSFQLPPLNVQDIPNDGAPGEFLGINVGGALDWLPAGGGGSGDMLAANNLSELTNFATARTNIGLGTTSTPTFANLTLTSPSLSSSAPVTISQTWNNAAVAFTGVKVNAVSTASASGSLLLDLQVGGVSQFTVRKDGAIVLPFGYAGIIDGSVNGGGTNYTWGGPRFGPTAFIAWTASSPAGTADTILLRDGAPNTLALRNGAAAQTFNVYGTSSASNANYARLALTCGLDGNATISTQALGTGTAGVLAFSPGNSERMRITAAGNVGIGTTAPSEKLDVAHNSPEVLDAAAYGLKLRNTHGSDFCCTGVLFNIRGDLDATLPGKGAIVYDGRAVGSFGRGDMHFLQSSVASVAVPTLNDAVLTLRNNGNVGIGTRTPTSKLHVAETWNNAGTAFCAIKSVITDTNSAAGSDFLELYSGTSTQPLRMDINKTGQINIYGTWTDASNYERLSFFAPTAGNAVIGTNRGSGSNTARGLNIQTDGANRWFFSVDGHFAAASDNTYDIGASGANRPRNVYVGNSVVVGSSNGLSGGITTDIGVGRGIIFGNRGQLSAIADGHFNLIDFVGTGFNRFSYGGTTSGYPALKRVGAELQIVIASTASAAGVAAPDADLTFIEDRYRRKGAGTPEGVVTAPIGAVYHNTTGGAGTSFYVKESGTGNTGWVGK